MKITVSIEDNEDGDNGRFVIPVILYKDQVETMYDLAYFFDAVVRCSGFTNNKYHGVALFDSDQADIACSTELGKINFGEPTIANKTYS